MCAKSNMNKLIHGDCKDVINSLPEGNYVIVTDPPFNVGYHYNSFKDNLPEQEYYNNLVNLFGDLPTVMIHYPECLHKYSVASGRVPTRIVSWVYNSNTKRQHRDIAFYGVKPDFRRSGQPYKDQKDLRNIKLMSEGKMARLYDWWQINQVKNISKVKTEHPCQMPLCVMLRTIKILPDDITVIDPFMGSGTTGLACKMLGVNFIGIEIDEKYYEISRKRIEEYDGGILEGKNVC